MILAGGCHCGNLRYELTTSRAIGELSIRACQCSFCRRHGALSTSDPNGRIRIAAIDPSHVVHYSFALRTATFFVCGRCGVYVGAALTDGSQSWAIVNVTCADTPVAGTPVPMDYDAEDVPRRIARRKANWSPAEIDVGG